MVMLWFKVYLRIKVNLEPLEMKNKVEIYELIHEGLLSERFVLRTNQLVYFSLYDEYLKEFCKFLQINFQLNVIILT